MPDDRDRRNDMYMGMGTSIYDLDEDFEIEQARQRMREQAHERATTSAEELPRSSSLQDDWETRLRRYMEDLYQARRSMRDAGWTLSYDVSINSWDRHLYLNDNLPVFHALENKDTEEMPLHRAGVACQNCGYGWGVHASWACPHFYRSNSERRKRWNKSLLSPKDRYLTPDMRKARKYSRISKRRLQKMTREQMLSKESLLK